MAAPGSLQRTPSVHSIHLDDEEQLQIALALSVEEADLAGDTDSVNDDMRFAMELQVNTKRSQYWGVVCNMA
jgi:hypothetical protein